MGTEPRMGTEPQMHTDERRYPHQSLARRIIKVFYEGYDGPTWLSRVVSCSN
jgi:hypothetical protein